MASPLQGTAAVPVKKALRSSLLRSCERCRRRKIKCDEYMPCNACTRLGLQCRVPSEERRERSPSFLEERVKRLESLLAQQEGRDEVFSSRPATPSGPIAGPSCLQLQIPTSPAISFAPDSDPLPSPLVDLQESQTGRSMSYCSSPGDFPSSPVGDMPPWYSSNALDFDGASFFDMPRRAQSFPITTGNEFSGLSNMNNFQNLNRQDTSLMVPEIPTIEVTSWDTLSSISNDTGMNGLAYSNLPDLSVGSWSGPPSPSLTAMSQGFGGQDDYLSDFDLQTRPHRFSTAFSEHEFDDFDSLKPTVTATSSFSHSRPRSRSDVLPQSTRHLDVFADSSSRVSSTPEPSFSFSGPMPDPFIPSANDTYYARTFFDQIHPFFPIISPQTFQAYASATSSELHTKHQKYTVLMVLAIGSQLQHNTGQCPAIVPKTHFNMAQQLRPDRIWDDTPSSTTIQSNLLLALYSILVSPSSIAQNNSSPSPINTNEPNIYMLTALISASILDLNLHRHTTLNSPEMGLFFSAYVLNKTVGFMLGKPCLLRDEDVDAELLGGVRRVVEAKRSGVEDGMVGSEWRGALDWVRQRKSHMVT